MTSQSLRIRLLLWASGAITLALVLAGLGLATLFDRYVERRIQDELAMPELLARLRAILRRSAGQASPVISIGAVSLDTRKMLVEVAGRDVGLTSQEYRLLAYLMHHAGRVVTTAEIIDHLYSGDNERAENSVEVFIGRIRRKLGVDLIHTRRGFGYFVDRGGL